MDDQVLKDAFKTDFFQNWLQDNSKIKKGKTDPCATLEAEGIEYNLCRKKQSLDNSLVNENFVSYINEKAGGTNYYINKLQIEEKKVKAEKVKNEALRQEKLAESYVTFLDRNNNYIDNGSVKVLSKEQADKILDNSTSASVISCLRQDSLSLGLRVFRMLGIFAIGAGVFLFLIGPIISKWMHGIK